MGLLTRFFRYERPPAAALAALRPGERLTAWATTADGDAVLATTRGLWLPGADQRSHLPWHLIHKATWDTSALRIMPGVEVDAGIVADGPPIAIDISEPRDLPAEVRTRVTRSVAYSSYHPLPGGGVRIVARRVPGVDGLAWVLRFDPDVDSTDPVVRTMATDLRDQARAIVEAPA